MIFIQILRIFNVSTCSPDFNFQGHDSKGKENAGSGIYILHSNTVSSQIRTLCNSFRFMLDMNFQFTQDCCFDRWSQRLDAIARNGWREHRHCRQGTAVLNHRLLSRGIEMVYVCIPAHTGSPENDGTDFLVNSPLRTIPSNLMSSIVKALSKSNSLS